MIFEFVKLVFSGFDERARWPPSPRFFSPRAQEYVSVCWGVVESRILTDEKTEACK